MKIKKIFESNIISVNRDKILDEISYKFEDGNFLGYKIKNFFYDSDKNEIFLFIDKKVVILDFSDIGIKIGEMNWNHDKKDFDDFILDVDLTSKKTKLAKSFVNDTNNYNI